MTELVMRKRAGRAGEIGLFVDSPVFEDDFGHIKMDAEVNVKATTPRSLRQIKFAWALATKIAEACDWLETKEDAMDFMLIEARHYRRIFDPLRNVAVLRPKPTNFGAMDGTEYTRLLKRLVHVATTVIVPGLDDTALRSEIESMVGPDIEPPPEDRKPRARKQKEVMPDPTERNSDTAGHDIAQPPTDPQPPALDQSAATAPLGPQNADEYVIACEAWIARQTDQRAAMSYFESDAQIQKRAELRVSVGQRKMLLRKLAEHFEAKK